MNYKIKDNVKDILLKAGWNENRKLDKNRLEQLIIQNGYDILPKVLDFLMVFEGIVIRFINLKNGISDDITIDFVKATQLESSDRIFQDYQLRIRRKLCIIGTAYREHFVLIMDEDGKVYGGYDNYLVKIADTGIGAIESIVNNEKFIEIP
jgi:hypothetical protein